MKSILLVMVGLLMIASAKADILRLRDGRMLTGEFLGATKDQIWFQADTPGGLVGPAAYSTAQVESLTFGPAPKQSDAKGAPPAKNVSQCYTRGSHEPPKTDPAPAQ
ncbi:MAG TPA: hypothetical protein VMG40_05215 [Bryobacteraceae bacterium]|nr:hypothetical protein [Bryobacteraceae bacterium]